MPAVHLTDGPAKRVAAAVAAFETLPDDAIVRAPVVARVRGISLASVWRYAKSGHLPPPQKIGPNATGWRVGELRRWDAKAA